MQDKDGHMDPAALMRRYLADRGDVYDELYVMAASIPDTVHLIHEMAGYVLVNRNIAKPDQVLSGQLRELIATCLLASKDERHFAASHIRRLYRWGITDRAILEAAECVAPIFGHSTILHVAGSIALANDPSYRFGAMPEGGAPTTITPFPEMETAEEPAAAPQSLIDEAEWQYALSVDPEYARRVAALADQCSGSPPRADRLLNPAIRALIAVPAACARGLQGLAAQHIRYAYACGFSERQIMEAVSVATNMTGAASATIGLRAMMQVRDQMAAPAMSPAR